MRLENEVIPRLRLGRSRSLIFNRAKSKMYSVLYSYFSAPFPTHHGFRDIRLDLTGNDIATQFYREGL